ISYSLYLWHWPPIVVLPFVLGGELGTTHKVAILLAVVVLAWLTKRWVEDPVRRTGRWGLRRPRVTFVWMIVAMGVIAAVAVLGVRSAQEKEQVALEVEQTAAEVYADCFGAPTMMGADGCPDPRL